MTKSGGLLRTVEALVVAVVVVGMTACGKSPPPTPITAAPPGAVVEVIARGLQFIAPEEVPSGWTTFRFRNESGMTHFAMIERLPDGYGIRDQQEQVAPIFQQGMDLLNAGDADGAMAKFGELPEWFGRVVFMGGPGLTGPGQISEVTVFLEPGTYLLECYVKTNGVFHSYNPAPDAYGMVHQFQVTEAVSPAGEPDADIRITLSGERDIEVVGDTTPGEHVAQVVFEDHKIYENFAGHDVHLVRLEDDTDLSQLATWMDWRQPSGLETPAPALFLGGTNEMPAGQTAYFNISLEPGRYAWIAEVPDPEGKGMLQVFTVSGDHTGGY